MDNRNNNSRSKRSSNNRERDLKVIFKYMIGRPIDEIVGSDSISKSTLYKVLKDHNIPLKTEKDAVEYFRKTIFTALIKHKKSIEQIAAEMNLDPNLINGYVRYEYDRISKESEKKKKIAEKESQIDINFVARGGSLKSGVRTNKGVSVWNTEEEIEKNSSKSVEFSDDEFLSLFEDDMNDQERIKLGMLRQLLKYANRMNGIEDYSSDKFLLQDYLLPVDIVIMKDIAARMSEGQDIEYVANTHFINKELVIDVIENRVSRGDFVRRYLSLVKNRSNLFKKPGE